MTEIIESGCGNTTILAGDEILNEITVAESAKERIAELLCNEDSKAFLRIAVIGGGCSGFQYMFGFDSELAEDDIIYKWENGQVVIDSMSMKFIKGATLNYINEFNGEYFSIENPSATSSCGCGTSFNMDYDI